MKYGFSFNGLNKQSEFVIFIWGKDLAWNFYLLQMQQEHRLLFWQGAISGGFLMKKYQQQHDSVPYVFETCVE